MGVYVSEINMPEGEGSKLVLQIFQNGEVYDGHGIRLGIANWAKAVSIPPHGRLIDADAFERLECNACDGACEMVECDCINCDAGCRCNFMLDIRAAPTIIPAEETEK